MTNQKSPKYHQNDLDDYEINFFEIFKYLWYQKILIIFITALVTIVGAAFTFYKPLPPVTYQGIGLVEIGTYIINNDNRYINNAKNQISIFENPNDLGIMIRHGDKVWASKPSGSEKLLLLETMSGYVDASTAKNYIQETIDKLILRHKDLETIFVSNGAEHIFPTTQIGEIKVKTLYPADNRRNNVILLFFGGILLSFIVVGLRYLIQKANKVDRVNPAKK